MIEKQIVFPEPNVAKFMDMPTVEPGERDIVIKTVVSTISCGTERANYTGDPNVSIYTSEVVFPRYCGYSSSGIVVKKGAKVTEVEIGDRVAATGAAHRTYATVPMDSCVKIESDKISFEEAAMFFICTFSMAAVRKTGIEVGESALVMGLGILGLFAVQFAHAAGAVPVIAADPIKERRELALKYGADYAFDPLEPDFAQKVNAVTGGGVNAAIEVTGKGAGLDETLDCMARFGRVALLGCTRNSDFTIDYYRKVHAPGISLIGAHTQARPHVESYPGHFTHIDDIKAVMKLCEYNRVNLKQMIMETYSPEECTRIYDRLANDKNFPPVVQFDWRRLKEIK